MDIEQARYNMVEQQIRTWEVLDQNVLDLLFRLKREDFVPPIYRALAFVDMEIPLGQGEKMLQPKQEARIVQELALKKTDRILEVGTGSGYMTALLAALGAHVYSVDIVPEFVRAAAEKLAGHGIRNASVEQGDAARGWAANGPYDVIVLTASTPILPQAFQENLNVGGRLFAIVGEPPVMEARLVTRRGGDAYNSTSLFETCVAPLKNALQPERFVF
jgi:protein-L-isoaspartate(D-aspartate) O-methyltransferase